VHLQFDPPRQQHGREWPQIHSLTQGNGRFNLASSALATMVGIGPTLSNAFGGMVIQRLGHRASFLGLAGIAALAFAMLRFTVPETANTSEAAMDSESLNAETRR
jgi:predicted MFS family arabinose efflux permease